MANEKLISERILKITESILDDYKKGRDIDKTDVFSQPDSDAVTDIVNKLLNILFPGYYREKNYRSYNDNSRISILIEDVVYNLTKQTAIALRFRDEYAEAEETVIRDTAEEIARLWTRIWKLFIREIRRPTTRKRSCCAIRAFWPALSTGSRTNCSFSKSR